MFYNLRFLGGRQPLWAIEVLSSIDKIFNPADFRARIEVSLPFPLPFITTSTFSIPNSIAFTAAFLAAL
jgi:hypothetical protein